MFEQFGVHHLQIADTEFVVCDVETTGLSPEKHRLTEIALVKIIDGRIVDRFESLVNARQFVPYEITRLTGITNDMVYSAPAIDAVLPSVKEFIGNAVFVAHNVRFDRSFIDTSFRRSGMQPLDLPNLCTARLARRIVPTLSRKSLGMLSKHFGISIRDRHRAAGDAEATAEVLLRFIHMLTEELDIHECSELLSFQNKPVYTIAQAPKNFSTLKATLSSLPHSAGVYFFHDHRGGVLYVGKAKDLKDRVSSYFYHNIGHTEKVLRLIKAVRSITWKETETELSALLSEARFIRQYQPKFNTMLKHERKYPFIRIDSADPFPTLSWSYDLDDEMAAYYGPFSSRFAVEQALESINKLFLIRECKGPLKVSPSSPPCLYYDIKRCGAPCATIQSREEYLDEVSAVELFLCGEHDEVLRSLQDRMKKKAQHLNFEEASVLRDRIQSLEKIIRQQRTMVQSIRKQNLVILTPARRTLVEVHLIRSGMLMRQLLLGQNVIAPITLLQALKEIFFSEQEEIFQGRMDDVNEMRIIASWCFTRRNESEIIEANSFADAQALFRNVAEKIKACGPQKKDIVQTHFARQA